MPLPNAVTSITVSPTTITDTTCPPNGDSPDKVTVNIQFIIPSAAVSGDTFIVHLPPELDIQYDFFGLVVPNTNPAEYMGTVEVNNNVATFTMNDYVNTYGDRKGYAYFYYGRCWTQGLSNGTVNLHFSGDVPAGSITQSIVIDGPTPTPTITPNQYRDPDPNGHHHRNGDPATHGDEHAHSNGHVGSAHGDQHA